MIAAEDTRKTATLLSLYGIKNKLISNHKFNEKKKVDFFIDKLENGYNIAIVSDAGTPCISDPGGILVNAAIKHNIKVECVCGASAVIAALSISGFSFVAFSFYGFLPRTRNEIHSIFSKASLSETKIGVFYESPNRIINTIDILCENFSECDICLCNDLTKKYELIYRGNPFDIKTELVRNEFATKGEYTLLIDFSKMSELERQENTKTNCMEADIIELMIHKGISLKDAISELSRTNTLGYSKHDYYCAGLHLKKMLMGDTYDN